MVFLVVENPEFRTLPSFLFGQSMGGAVALKVHLKQPDSWTGAVLVAPMCKVLSLTLLVAFSFELYIKLFPTIADCRRHGSIMVVDPSSNWCSKSSSKAEACSNEWFYWNGIPRQKENTAGCFFFTFSLSALYFVFPYLHLTVSNIQLYGWMQATYNVIAYKDKPRLGTALELLRTTQEIENELEEVCHYLD